MAEKADEYRQRIQALRRMAKASKHAEEPKLLEQLAVLLCRATRPREKRRERSALKCMPAARLFHCKCDCPDLSQNKQLPN